VSEAHVLVGDSREKLRELPDDFFHCCICSPPYFGMRAYDVIHSIWGGDRSCEHVWVETDGGLMNENRNALRGSAESIRGKTGTVYSFKYDRKKTQACTQCGAWNGALGQEPTPEMYVEHLLEVLREVRRVLRPDGTLWLVIGDGYWTAKGSCKNPGGGENSLSRAVKEEGALPLYRGNRRDCPHIKTGSFIGVPWRLAFGAQGMSVIPSTRINEWISRLVQSASGDNYAEVIPEVTQEMRAWTLQTTMESHGWVLRGDVIWAKPNPMPESMVGWEDEVRDETCQHCGGGGCFKCWQGRRVSRKRGGGRLVKSHEHVFVFTKTDDYYFDTEAIVERTGDGEASSDEERSRRCRDVFHVPVAQYRGKHYATYPERLVQPPLFAGTSSGGCCSMCGSPRVRVLETISRVIAGGSPGVPREERGSFAEVQGSSHSDRVGITQSVRKTHGWAWTCKCEGQGEAKPCRVLDPFAGAGTTALVAGKFDRDSWNVELSENYADQMEGRLDGELGILIDIKRD